jgi:hypothetical protein
LKIAILKAIDDDGGDNSQLNYTLNGGDGLVDIDSQTALITVIAPLDRETQSSLTLTITVVDNASPPMSAVTGVELIIDDGK